MKVLFGYFPKKTFTDDSYFIIFKDSIVNNKHGQHDVISFEGIPIKSNKILTENEIKIITSNVESNRFGLYDKDFNTLLEITL